MNLVSFSNNFFLVHCFFFLLGSLSRWTHVVGMPNKNKSYWSSKGTKELHDISYHYFFLVKETYNNFSQISFRNLVSCYLVNNSLIQAWLDKDSQAL